MSSLKPTAASRKRALSEVGEVSKRTRVEQPVGAVLVSDQVVITSSTVQTDLPGVLSAMVLEYYGSLHVATAFRPTLVELTRPEWYDSDSWAFARLQSICLPGCDLDGSCLSCSLYDAIGATLM